VSLDWPDDILLLGGEGGEDSAESLGTAEQSGEVMWDDEESSFRVHVICPATNVRAMSNLG
jgi:hypothetical protein